jgi:signal transduction histidine kinase
MDLKLDYQVTANENSGMDSGFNLYQPTDEIRTDESKLRLVLYNLLSNSVRYSQTGLISVKTRYLTIH